MKSIRIYREHAAKDGRVLPSKEFADLHLVVRASSDHKVAEVELAPGQGLKPVALWIRMKDFPSELRCTLIRASVSQRPADVTLVVEYNAEREEVDVKRIWIREEEREVFFFASEANART